MVSKSSREMPTESKKNKISDHSKRTGLPFLNKEDINRKRTGLPFLTKKDINRDSGSSSRLYLAFHFNTCYLYYNINFINEIRGFYFSLLIR